MNTIRFIQPSLLVLCVALTSFSVHAQKEGETRCGADGFVQEYKLNRWHPTGTRCAARETATRQICSEGDTKCGADGYVLTCTKTITGSLVWEKIWHNKCKN